MVSLSAALEWLKINHSDYADVQISQENLKLYPEEGPPVVIDYRSSIINKHKEATSVFDMEEEEGVHDGVGIGLCNLSHGFQID